MIVAGILTPLEHFFRHALNGLHQIGLPWAWAIVALTVIVRIVLVPVTVKQIHSMQNMQRFAPQMKEIQKKYKGDRQRLNEELMKFYKENNINPAASCLPLLLQIPVFIGLYYTLMSTRLSAADSAYIVKDSQARIAITTSSMESWQARFATASENPPPVLAPGREMLYSSGTTGRPKGVRKPPFEGRFDDVDNRNAALAAGFRYVRERRAGERRSAAVSDAIPGP